MEEIEKNKSELQREFELERVILFSDAVFAIAITLLVLDLKYTEHTENAGPLSWDNILHPLLLPFISLLISFVFIGAQWAKHIEHMRYVRQYDKRFIVLNLVFLFFIVLFPFTASFLGKTNPSNQLPYIVVYTGDIVLCTLAFYALSAYIFKIKPALCFPGNEEKKNLLLRKDLISFITICLLSLCIFSLTFVANNNLVMSFIILAFVILIRLVRWMLTKKPEKMTG